MQTELLTLLKAHQAIDTTEEAHRQQTCDFVAANQACCSRETIAGHVTASAWVLSPDGQSTLLTHHRKLNRWLQLGGHVEADATIRQAALREAREESGIDDLTLLDAAIFDIDVHLIPARKTEAAHYHYDLRFLMQAATWDFVVSEESNQIAWVKLTEVSNLVADESVLRMVRKSTSYQPSFHDG